MRTKRPKFLDRASKVDSESDGEGTELVPRFPQQGYAPEHVAKRRDWVAAKTGASMELVGDCTLDCEAMRGNIENPIGSVQMPLGVAGPLEVNGEHASGKFYVPLATTEGALVRSYERGMLAITRSGGATTRLVRTENRTCPIFKCADVAAAAELFGVVQRSFDAIKSEAESTTRHGKLLSATPRLAGRDVIVTCSFDTADAHGMNMIGKATDAICRWIVRQFPVESSYVMSGGSAEKRPSAFLLQGGKGRYVTAGVRLSARTTKLYLHSNPAAMVDMWRRTMVGQTLSGVTGYNGHYANGLTALFIATGQDVANVANSALGMTHFEETDDGGLHVSVTLPSLTIGTVGGGTGIGTSAECLEMLGCRGSGHAKKFAEITAATILAGELSFGAALASGEFIAAHEEYGRNRPDETARDSHTVAEAQNRG